MIFRLYHRPSSENLGFRFQFRVKLILQGRVGDHGEFLELAFHACRQFDEFVGPEVPLDQRLEVLLRDFRP